MVPFSRFSVLDGIVHAVGTRHGGVSMPPYESLNVGYGTADSEENVLANRGLFLDSLGISAECAISGWLTHGKDVAVFRASEPESWPIVKSRVRKGSERLVAMFRGDAVVSDAPGLFFMLTFADCVPLLFADRRRGVVGAAHAGWRGSALGIGPAVVRTIVDQFDCDQRDIVAGIGPSIGPCCYSVGEDVPRAFRANGFEPRVAISNAGMHLDLWESNRQQLVDAGVAASAIETAGICTCCETGTYFSHRGEAGNTGRFATCIGCP